jgi:uncharacterized protein (AIM24 family)
MSRVKKNNNNVNVKKDYSKLNKLNSSYIPEYKILNKPSFSILKLNLEKGQTIISQGNNLVGITDGVELDTSLNKGIFKSFTKMILTGLNFFKIKYTGKSNNKDDNELILGDFLPSDILPIILKPSEQILINPYALMANSENITNEMKRNFRGLFSGSNFVLLNMLNKSNDNGAIFLSSYGGIFNEI